MPLSVVCVRDFFVPNIELAEAVESVQLISFAEGAKVYRKEG